MTQQDTEAYRGFFAITPPSEVRSALFDAAVQLQSEPWASKVLWSPAENLHLTVRFMGKRTQHDFNFWLDELRSELAAMQPFEVQVEQIALFPNHHRPVAIAALVPTTPELAALVEKVESVVQSRALPERKDYMGHFTLGRCQRGFDRHAGIPDVPLNLVLPVRSVDLYRSDMQPDGVRYTRMAELPLSTQ